MAALVAWCGSVARWVPLALAALAGVGVVKVVSSPDASVGYPQTSPALALMAMAAGFALTLAGVAHLVQRRSASVGVFAGLAALAWFAPTWIGWQGSPDLARSLAEPVAVLLVPAVLLLIVHHRGTDTPSWTRFGAGLSLAGVVATSVLLALVRNPYLDSGCWANCTTNVFLVSEHPGLASGVQALQSLLIGAAGLALVAVGLSRLGVLPGWARDHATAVALPGATLGLAAIGRLVEIHRAGIEDPYDATLQLAFVLAAVSLLLLGLVLIAEVVRGTRVRAAIDRVVRDLGEAPAPGSVESALGEAVGDRSLTIAYRLPGSEAYVDTRGKGAPATITAGRSIARITRHGEAIALITCTSNAVQHLRALGPALVLGLENERLQVGLSAQLEDLRSSRARIVAAADSARSRLERDLHDGAQQHLLALSFDLRLALASAERDGEHGPAQHLARAGDLAQQALGELRTLAHGLFPAALSQGGLDAGLATMAEVAPIAVRLSTTTGPGAVPSSIASAAYFATLLALEEAAGRGASVATIATELRDGVLVLSIDDDGSARTAGMIGLTDRVGALGGAVSFGPQSCEVVIPCG